MRKSKSKGIREKKLWFVTEPVQQDDTKLTKQGDSFRKNEKLSNQINPSKLEVRVREKR